MIDEYYTFLIFGYHSNDLKPHSTKYIVVVCDGCGVYNSVPMYQYSRNSGMCIKCAAKFRELVQKPPLPDGWQSKLSDITDNKSSAVYLGSIAEIILSNIYSGVRVMPINNHGYDIICNRDFKIDIKSSAIGDKRGRWEFRINKNQTADHFLCIAFNSRDDLKNPVHLWMIPGHVVNHMTTICISKSTLDKWSEYKLSLDKLEACCNDLNP